MRCPKCTTSDDKVIDSRLSKEGTSIRRRRECLGCGHRYSTTEFIVREGIVVIKRDGRREDFDREKIVRAARAACQKRPVDAEQIGLLITEVVEALEAQHDTDIPSRTIGDAVMLRLRKIDEVAYVRFASVYKEFRDVSEFMHEINSLDKKPVPPA